MEQLVARRELDRVVGSQVDGRWWVVEARQTLEAARKLAPDHPRNAYGLAYEAVRYACTGLLAQQGLRPTTDGGHIAVERAMRAQFGSGFAEFGGLRRRRHEIQYPLTPGEPVDDAEIDKALVDAMKLVDAAEALLPELGLF